MLALPFLLALLAAPRVAADEATAPPAPAGLPRPSTEEGRLRRALEILGEGDGGRARLALEAAGGDAASRRAALEALATLPPGTVPAGTLEAALGALGSEDPLLRRAAVRALLAAGDPAAAALERLARGPVEGLPPVRAARARDALLDLRRAAVERDFLGIWTRDDGTFRGMYADLKKHGAFGARVLAAVVLDRRMAAGDLLAYGPYAWLADPAASRERTDCRFRALEALGDAGDADAREMLRTSLRAEPAPELYNELDVNPIPAPLDDALREAIAALGDPEPLKDMIEASANAAHGVWDETVEMRRRAGAYAVLAIASPESRSDYLREAERLLRDSLRTKREYGIPVDGVEYYNLACLLARRDAPKDAGGERDAERSPPENERLLSDRAVALKYLRRAVKTYSVSSAWLARDGDLSSLHGEAEFQALLADLRRKEKLLERGLPPR